MGASITKSPASAIGCWADANTRTSPPREMPEATGRGSSQKRHHDAKVVEGIEVRPVLDRRQHAHDRRAEAQITSKSRSTSARVLTTLTIRYRNAGRSCRGTSAP